MRRALVLALLALACTDAEPPRPEEGSQGPAAQRAAETAEPVTEWTARVVDRRTGQGVPALFVELERDGVVLRGRTDEAGELRAPEGLDPGRWRVRLRLGPGTPPLASRPFRIEYHPEDPGGAPRLEVEVGPALALRLGAAGEVAPGRWEARLVERDAAGQDRAWSWRRLIEGALPLLRYPSLEHPAEPGFHARVEVRLRDGDWFGRAPVRSTLTVALQEVPLRLVQLAAFGGIVQDVSGRAVPGALVRLWQERGSVLPLHDSRPRSVRTDTEGAFHFEQELEPGRYHLRLASEGRATSDLDLELAEGGLEGYVLRVADVEAREVLAGRVEATGSSEAPVVILGLRRDDGRVERVLHPLQEPGAERRGATWTLGEGVQGFRFEALPAGSYDLAVFPLDGRPYAPAWTRVEVPGQEVVLRAPPIAAPALLRLDVRSGAGGGEPDHVHLALRAPGWWLPSDHRLAPGAPVAELSAESGLTWSLWAHGHRPARGSLAELPVEEVSGHLVLRRELEPGWGMEVFVRDAGPRGAPDSEDSYTQMALARLRPAVPGVVFTGDGRRLGRSDAAGVARLEADAAPRRVEFEAAGWRLVPSAGYDGQRFIDVQGGEDEVASAVLWLEEE